MRRKAKIFFLIKVSISLVLLYWLLQRGDLSLRNIRMGLSNLYLCAFFLFLTLCQLLLGAVRMYALMQPHMNSRHTLSKILSITWASIFINSIAPTALIGEAYRIKELMTVDQSLNKDNAFYASLLSKMFSIIGLIGITILASLVSKNHPQQIKGVLYFLYIFLLVIITFYFFRNRIAVLSGPLLDKACSLNSSQFWQHRIENLRYYFRVFIRSGRLAGTALLISFLIQLLNTFSFLLIIHYVHDGTGLNILSIVYVIPLGFFAMMLPVSISGIGVGHVAFSKLLGMFGIGGGADIFTIYFAYSYLFNLIGIFPFIKLYQRSSG